MSEGLVERLRERALFYRNAATRSAFVDAADEIERLTAERDRYREALEKIANGDLDDGDNIGYGEEAMLSDAIQIATDALVRRALQEETE